MSQGRRPGAKIYSSLYDLFLKEGRLFNPEPYTPEEEAELLEVFDLMHRTPEIKQCFYNSQAVALDGGLGYAEGQFINIDIAIPLEHAWNYLPSGKVVDVTVRPRGEKNTCKPKKLLERAKRNQNNAYFGIPFPAPLIQKTWLETQQAIMLLGYPPIQEIIFEKGYPPEWKKGAFWNRRVPSPWELSGLPGGSSGSGFSAVPSPRGNSVVSLRGSSLGFIPVPSPLGKGFVLAEGPYRDYIAEPSPLEESDLEMASREFAAEPAPMELCGYGGPSIKMRAGPSPRGGRALGAVGKPSPEEEWLRAQEREGLPPDETRSPFRGRHPSLGTARIRRYLPPGRQGVLHHRLYRCRARPSFQVAGAGGQSRCWARLFR